PDDSGSAMAQRVNLMWKAETLAQDVIEWAEVRCMTGNHPTEDEKRIHREDLAQTLKGIDDRFLVDSIAARFEYLASGAERGDSLFAALLKDRPDDPFALLQKARAH